MRQRAMLVEYASHHIQHMQKELTQEAQDALFKAGGLKQAPLLTPHRG